MAAKEPAGTPLYDLKYVEWSRVGVSSPQHLLTVKRRVGLSLAFDPISKAPVAALLGGASGPSGASVYWAHSDTTLVRRAASGTWVETAVAVSSAPPACSPIGQGFLVGLWSNLVFDAVGKLYVAFRDGHNGQFPHQDWAASDVELLEGGSEATSLTRRCLTGDHKQAYGGRIQLAIGAQNQPAIVYDQAFGGADVAGQNVLFQQRTADGGWTMPVALLTISDTMSGPSLAYDSVEGYGIAVTDRTTNHLTKYIRSTSGTSRSVPDDVFGSGTGGWYPSLAMDPLHHEPAIAFYESVNALTATGAR